MYERHFFWPSHLNICVLDDPIHLINRVLNFINPRSQYRTSWTYEMSIVLPICVESLWNVVSWKDLNISDSSTVFPGRQLTHTHAQTCEYYIHTHVCMHALRSYNELVTSQSSLKMSCCSMEASKVWDIGSHVCGAMHNTSPFPNTLVPPASWTTSSH